LPLLQKIVLHHRKTIIKTMKKNILLAAGLLLAFLVQNSANAQNQTKDFSDVKGMNLLNAGIGLGSYGLYGTGGLPVVASFEHGFTKNITAGIEAGFVQRSYAVDWTYTYVLVGARGSYHFSEVLKIANPKLDVYGGAGLIYRNYNSSVKLSGNQPGNAYNSNDSDMTIDLHAGAHYFFSDHVGGFAELSYGISPLKLGVALTF